MRDLEFEPAIPIFSKALAGSEGGLAAVNLAELGAKGASELIAAMQHTNPVIRAHAMAAATELRTTRRQFFGENERVPLHPELLKMLPALLKDPDPEVRLHAAETAALSPRPAFFNLILELLRDDYTEVSDAAKAYLRSQREELPKHDGLFRQMLKDTNVNVQIAGFQLCSTEIPREELLALLGVPRRELALAAAGRLKSSGGITCEEAKPLLTNALPFARFVGLAFLIRNQDSQAVELMIPMLRDPDEVIQTRAHDYLTDLTGQSFPAEQPEQWEAWWKENRATFTVKISEEDLRKKQRERLRQRQKR